MGFPDFDNDEEDALATTVLDTTKVNLREFDDFLSYRGVIQTLPGTKKEIEAIEKLLKSKNANIIKLMLSKANESQLKRVKSPSILHIATHGYFMQDIKEEEEEISKKTKEINPLMRSGLLLAGSQKTFNKIAKSNEDGVLTAFEAQTLDLSGTNLVVLSACETAQGEGCFWFTESFSGSRS